MTSRIATNDWFLRRILTGLIALSIMGSMKMFPLSILSELIIALLIAFSPKLRSEIIASRKDSFVAALVFAFLFFVACAVLYSPASLWDSFEDLLSWKKVLIFFAAILAFKVVNNFILMSFFIIGASFGFSFFAFGVSMGWIDYTSGPASILENHTAQTIVFVFSLSLSWLVWPQASRASRGLIICGALCIVYNVIMESSGRSGYIYAIVLSCLISLYYVKERLVLKWIIPILVGVCLIVTFAITPNSSGRLIQAFDNLNSYSQEDSENTSTGIRIIMWQNTWKLINKQPILGVGAAAFYSEYQKLVAEDGTWRAIVTDDPHQQYLHIWAEYGIGALLTVVTLLVVVVYRLARLGLNRPVIVCLSGIISLSASCLFNGHMATFTEGRIFWLLLGFGCALILSQHESRRFANEQ